MILLIILAVIYIVIGFAWGSFLTALTTPNGMTSWWAVLHGVFWPISMAGLLR